MAEAGGMATGAGVERPASSARRSGWEGRYTGRHALITGASSGIGAALALRLARSGARLTLVGRNLDRLAAVREACIAAGAPCNFHGCDVTDASHLARLLEAVDDDAPIDVLVANAGLGGVAALAPPSGESEQQARAIFETNTMGVIHTIRPLIGRIMGRRRGHIIIVSSLMGLQGLADAPVYSASKAAVRIYGQGLRRLMRPFGVKVLVACPAFVTTPMSEGLPMAMPFRISADAAAVRILRAAAADRAEIVFPWQWRLVAAVASLLPHWLIDPILGAARRKLGRAQ